MAWKPDYVTDTQLKSFVRVEDTEDDAEIAFAITAASRAIDRATNRQFGQAAAAVERFYTAEWDCDRGRWVVEIDDLMTDTGLLIDYDVDDDETYSASIDDYRLQPVNAAADSRPWTRVVVHPNSTNKPSARENAVRVTAQFGWTSVPTAIEQACLLQASRFLARREAPFGVAGSPDVGSETRLLAKLDPDVEVAVGPYRRWWAAA